MKQTLIYKFLLFFFITSISLSCNQENNIVNKKFIINRTELTHSYANIDEVFTSHLHLDLDVDFESNIIYGVARHKMVNKNADTAIFDIKNLEIQKITIGKKGDEVETNYVIGKEDEVLGQPLFVKIDENDTDINIYYKTTTKSEALDWLSPNLTSGKIHPFMYSQGEAILTRSWIPIQDLPSNRITYSANVKVPEGLMALMSADNPVIKSDNGFYTFEMNKKIPSYLIALAVGDFEYTKIGEKCGVYSESQLANQCAQEFGDLPKMITAAEKLFGKYNWDRYDLMVLPYSFPFGGMENPKLTFISPTLITGDRSLVSVIAHELAHSWSGNLVTNATWEDFWLNEGFTVYFENRIMEELYGKEVADMLAYVEFQELQRELILIDGSDYPEDSQLKLNLKGRDPDKGMTSIAYVKGAFFLKTLEAEVGRPKFDKFLKSYFRKFKFESVSTETFSKFLQNKLLKPKRIKFNTKEWLYRGGLPDNCLKINPTRFIDIQKMAKDYSLGKNVFKRKVKRSDFITQEWIVFIRALSGEIDVQKLRKLDVLFDFKGCGNSEVMTEWFLLAIKSNYNDLRPELKQMLLKIGRRKYLELIYSELSKSKNNLNWAKQIFKEAKNNYHFVSVKTIEGILYGK